MLVVAAQLTFAQDMALPGLDLRHHPRQQPQPVVGRQDRHAEHVAEYSEDEQGLHRGADFQCLLRDLVTGHPVQEFTQRPAPPFGEGRAIIPVAMTDLIAIAAVALVAWFSAGTIWNIRWGRMLMRWMQDGLPALGQRTTVRWLGSTAVEMVIRDGKAPFTGVTLVIFLEPRDIPWMWAIGRLRGRCDTLIIRAVLRRAPEIELEAFDPASWSGRDALPRVPREWSLRRAKRPGGVVSHYASAEALVRADALLAQAEHVGLAVKRLSVRRSEPNFQLHVSLPDSGQPARDFFEVVHALAERVLA